MRPGKLLALNRLAAHGCSVEHVELSGGRVAYRLSGPAAAPAIVLTHGGLLDAHCWTPQVEALSPDHRVLTWDLPGHGGSSPLRPYSNRGAAELLRQLMDHLELSRATQVGLSVGGYVAQEFALAHMDRVAGLALLGTTPVARSRLPPPVSALLRSSSTFMRPIPMPWLRWFVGRTLARTAGARSQIRRAAGRVSKADFLQFWGGVSRGLRFDEGARLPSPLLICHGEGDLVMPVRLLSRRFAQARPDADYVVVSGAGHCVNLDRPDVVSQLLRLLVARSRAAP